MRDADPSSLSQAKSARTYLKIIKAKNCQGHGSVVESLPVQHKALNSNPSTVLIISNNADDKKHHSHLWL
jgi:hypothetical protein